MDLVVTARRWERGWELWIDEHHVTQSRTLADAEQQVRDYLDTDDPVVDHNGWQIAVVPDIGPLSDEVAQARRATELAARSAQSAAKQSRETVRHLRSAGYSVTDSAIILGVSRGRVSQLANG
ncbi:MAG: antitoxin HicB [Propionibacteriaceae bacterium]|jgi:DNA-directed RNA polymerase specialized sigma24 family protein|nr:antitoxin HicB [Propionibacteriaceae bacterium]